MINITEKFKLRKIIFYSRQEGYQDRMPGLFKIYGTNDINLFNTAKYSSGWTEIYNQTTLKYPNNTNTINIYDNITTNKYFSCKIKGCSKKLRACIPKKVNTV